MENSISLRDVTENDLPIFYEQQLEPEATEMAAFDARERDEFMAHWLKILANDALKKQTIVFNGEVAGNIVCWQQAAEWQVGYWLGKQYWGQGIATTALSLFIQQLPMRPLYGYVAEHNLASRRVLEKCGFVVSGSARHLADSGEVIEEVILMLGWNKK